MAKKPTGKPGTAKAGGGRGGGGAGAKGRGVKAGATGVAKGEAGMPAREPTEHVARLSEVVGQSRALGVLAGAVRSGRVHHAWIFRGPRGVGKRTAAVAFGGALLDPTCRVDGSGRLVVDEGSATRRLLEAGSHPDLHVVRKELAAVSRDPEVRTRKQTNIAVEVVREFMLEPAALSRVVPGETAASRVFVVDEAELLDDAGQNALLKLLEEPAPGRVIILVTSREGDLLPTIRSRCQLVTFEPLERAALEAWVTREEKAGAAWTAGLRAMSAAERAWLVEYAAGSPGELVSAVERGLIAWQRTVAPILSALDAGACPADAGLALSKLVDDAAGAWVKSHPNASKDAANRAAMRTLFAMLGAHFGQRVRAGAGWSAQGKGAALGGAGSVGAAAAARALDRIVQAEAHADANVRAVFVLENLCAQIAEEAAAG